MTTVQRIRCQSCCQGNHDKCKNPSECLCANDYNHGKDPKPESLKDGVRVKEEGRFNLEDLKNEFSDYIGWKDLPEEWKNKLPSYLKEDNLPEHCQIERETFLRLKNYKVTNPSIKQVEDYLNTQIKEDPTLVKQLVRTYLSTYTNNPINLAILAPSSDGKTHAVVETSKIFPKKDIMMIGRLSPTALIHQNGFLIDENGNNIDEQIEDLYQRIADAKTANSNKKLNKELEKELAKELKDILKNARKCVDLSNKILLFLDNPNPQTYEMLKPIMSHDAREIEYNTTKGDGSLNVKKSVIRGWPVFIFCSAKNEDKNEVWEEIKTRVFMTSPNSDVKKYQEANKFTTLKFSRPTWAKELYQDEKEKETAKTLIQKFKERLTELCKDGNNPVINSFDQLIAEKFPHSQGVSMRHLTRLMSFINLETLLNAEYNPGLLFTTKDDKFVRSVFTTITDIDNACQVLKNISTISPEKLKFYNEIFKTAMQETLNCGLTSKELADKFTQKFDKPITVKQITENYLKPLVDAGVLATKENPENTSQYLYETASTVTVHNLEDLKSTLVDTSTPIGVYIDSCLESLEKVSTKIGKSKVNFSIDGNQDYKLYCEFLKISKDELKDILIDEKKKRKIILDYIEKSEKSWIRHKQNMSMDFGNQSTHQEKKSCLN